MKPGVLVISHGSREADWVRLVDEAVETVGRSVRWPLAGGRASAAADEAGKKAAPTDEAGEKPTLPGDADGKLDSSGDPTEGTLVDDGLPVPVVSSFLEIVEGRLIQDGIDRLEAEGVTDLYVLPLFVSSGSTHVDDIAQAFGQPPVSAERTGELEPFRISSRTRVHFGAPIDDDPVIAELLYSNIRELSESPARESLLLIAHGASDAVFQERWRRGMTQLARRLRELGGFAHAEIAMLLPDEAASKLQALTQQRPDEAVIVVPLFLSSGYFTRTVIPSRLGELPYRYNGRAMLPHPCVLRWMERQIGPWLAGLASD
ncbi:cobalamin biosynthesis protein CbiX [Paenibacillus sp. sptzw28]|nr:cobalamin biosynthesis protein CbiX [Paenibacillus sp. sptzw28]